MGAEGRQKLVKEQIKVTTAFYQIILAAQDMDTLNKRAVSLKEKFTFTYCM